MMDLLVRVELALLVAAAGARTGSPAGGELVALVGSLSPTGSVGPTGSLGPARCAAAAGAC